MFFFFPYGTDAPIYHWPIITVLMIAVNTIVFCLELAYPEQVGPFILTFGNGLHPMQWITSNFLHAGLMHLAGNMFALWSFGLVIEGKLGWLKTLALYLGTGIIESAIVQYMMLGSLNGGGGLGASGIIYGLMAMSLIWAPVNKIQCFLVVVLFVFFRTATFDISIMAMVGLMLLIQITVQFFIGMQISSAAMHIIGASVGFAVAVALLKARLVDCENWDIFSVLAGRNTMTEEEREQADYEKQASQQQPEKINQQSLRETALNQIHEIIQNDQPQLALKFHQRLSREIPDWELPENDLFKLILGLHKNKLLAESVPLMAEYIAKHPLKAALVRLKLAQILVTVQNRPAQALKQMDKIDATALDARQREFLDKLRAKAKQLHQLNPYEIADHEF
jgi:membrane associated rhomboid family serine protease